MYSNTIEKKKIPKLKFCLLAVLILTKIHLYKVVLRLTFSTICAVISQFQIKNLVQLQ